jgi:hypothetical protein
MELDSTFLESLLPPADVVEALINSYFDTVHWFMFILHEGSFRQQARQFIAQGPQIKTGSDADFATLLMMVIAMGAQYADRNPNWKYKNLMAHHSVNLAALTLKCISQVRAHLLDSVERCQLEAVQTCIMLGTYYLYHGNPNLSWSVLGLAVKVSYALDMHREVEWKGSNALLQARKRTWGHTYIADTFAAVIYGRPAIVDRRFCDVSYPDECDDTEIPMPMKRYLLSVNDGKSLSKLTFHAHKYLLYEIKAQIISKIYTSRARASFRTGGSGVSKLVRTVQSFDSKLKAWRSNLPAFFRQSSWTSGNGHPNDVFSGLHENLSEPEDQIRRHLVMQRIAMQLLYDYILILLHRPLLEYRLTSRQPGQLSTLSNRNPFPNSFETCISAAMRLSYTPVSCFEYNCAIALGTMQMLTAGVILCIPATIDPLSDLAHKSKGAVVRMIRMFRQLSTQTPVVAQSCTILEELMKVVLKRELDMILQPEPLRHENAISKSTTEEFSRRARESNTGPNIPLSHSTHPSSKIPNELPLSQHSCSPFPPQAAQMPPGVRVNERVPLNPAIGSEIQQSSLTQVDIDNETFPGSFGDNSLYTVSTEGSRSQIDDFIDAEPDHGFSVAFGALERGRFVRLRLTHRLLTMCSNVRCRAIRVDESRVDALV